MESLKSVAVLLLVSLAFLFALPAIAAQQIDPQLLGQKKLTVCGGWVLPDGSRDAFGCKSFAVNFRNGQMYAAYQLYPEVAVYTGNIDSSAAVLAIETPTPESARLEVRMDLADFPPVNGIPQVYIEAVCELFATDHQHMAGVVTSKWYDNRRLDGHPRLFEMDHGTCNIDPA